MQADYSECLRRILIHEGGYCNDAADPGGPTNFGITLADYRRYGIRNATAADVRSMKLDEAKTIYRAKYWNALSCDDLPKGVDDTIFDYGVNSGIARAGKVLRRVLGLPDSDWRVTTDVLTALGKRDPKAVISAINSERLRFLQSLKTWPVFGKGWGRRVTEVNAFSLALAAGQLPVMPTAPAQGKGHVPQPTTAHKTIGAGAGTVVVGTAAWHPHVAPAVLIAGAAVAGAAIVYLEYRRTVKQQAATPGLIPVPATKAA